MEITLTDRFKLKPVDELNMRLYEYREVDAGKSRSCGSETRAEWRATGNYFHDVPSAVAFVYRKMQRDDPYRGDLAGALLRMEALAAQLSGAAR